MKTINPYKDHIEARSFGQVPEEYVGYVLVGRDIVWYTKEWYFDGKCHNIYGPMFICGLDLRFPRHEWYINNKKVTEKQHKLFVDLLKLKGLYE